MALTTIDLTSALVVIDLQKGIVSAHTDNPVTAVVKQAAHLATDAMSDPDADAHRHSIERVFPKLGETATTTEIIDMIEATR